MNRYLALLLIVWGSLITGCVRHADVVVPLPEKARSETIALVDVKDSDAKKSAEDEEEDVLTTKVYCSGVWVNSDTFVTAYHCAEAAVTIKAVAKMTPREKAMAHFFGVGMPEVTQDDIMKMEYRYITSSEVTDPESNPTKTFSAKAIALDEEHDLAVLRAQNNVPRHMSAPIASKLPGVGEEVVAMGHPAGLYFTYSKGTFAAVRKNLPVDKKGPWVQLVVPGVFRGSSGGAAFDSHGCIIGIASFMVRAPNEAMYVHADTVHELLQKHKISHVYSM